MGQTPRITSAALLLGLASALLMSTLTAAQVDPVNTNDSEASSNQIEMLKKVQGGDQELRTKFVRHYIKDFGCTHPQRAMNVMTRLYMMRPLEAAGVLDTLSKIMEDAHAVVKYAPPTPAQCKEWTAAQEAADKAAQAKGKP